MMLEIRSTIIFYCACNLKSKFFSDDEQIEDVSVFENLTQNNSDNNEKIESGKLGLDNVETNSNASRYVKELDNRGFNIDTAFGVRKAYGKYKIGNQIIDFKDGKIIIGDQIYHETPGLLELLFEKKVDEKLVTANDATLFQEIAVNTNLLRRKFEPNTSFKEPNLHAKFDTYL